MLSWFLLKKNCKILVIDEFNPSAASNIASGIVNPVTGRRLVKTWLADELIPFALETYHDLESFFQTEFYKEVAILKVIDSVKVQNDWASKCGTEEYLPYLENENVLRLPEDLVKNPMGYFEIQKAGSLLLSKLLGVFRKFLFEKNILIDQRFHFDELKIDENEIFYKDFKSKKVIFCEGTAAESNPYFGYLPFVPAKGEALKLKIPKLHFQNILSGKIKLMPTAEADIYYAGATYEWDFEDDQPSETGRMKLIEKLEKLLNIPYQIISHEAAVRPTVRDRRPLAGLHPKHKTLAVFNGMGTKGISLAPYFAQEFAGYLFGGNKLNPEVDISRFEKFYARSAT